MPLAASPPAAPPTASFPGAAAPSARGALLQGLSGASALRYYLYSRARVSPAVVFALASPALPPAHLSDEAAHEALLWAVSGAAKAVVVQLSEEAVALARAGGHEGPLLEAHINEAWRRLQARGALAGLAPPQLTAQAAPAEEEEEEIER